MNTFPLSEVMLANNFSDQDPTGHWMSEKLDGVRAVWSGKHLYSRNGNPINAPHWFIEQLPAGVILDGELWEGRGQFQVTASRVRASGGDWSNMKFMVFDLVSSQPFEKRQAELNSLSLPEHSQVVEHVLCTGPRHLEQFESNLLEQKAEGVMIREHGSAYTQGRSNSLLKLKRFYDDEARVISYKKGTGKQTGLIVSLGCSWRGKKFFLGSGLTNELKTNPPKLGSKVTFRYFEKTEAGLPRHPVFITTRDYEGPINIKNQHLHVEFDLADLIDNKNFSFLSEAEHHSKYDTSLMKEAMDDTSFHTFIIHHFGDDDWLEPAELFSKPDIILKAERHNDFGTFLPRDLYRTKVWHLYLAFLSDIRPNSQEHEELIKITKLLEWQRHSITATQQSKEHQHV